MVDGEDRRLCGDVGVDEIVAGDAFAHQAAGVVLLRLEQDLSRIAEFDDLAVPQHHDSIRDLRDDREVVGDVEGRGAMLANELAEGGEALDLSGHVKRGCRLVEDEDVGLGDHRHRRHHALELSAGNLMRIARAERLRARQIELPEQADASARAASRDKTPWRTDASQTCSISVWAGLKEAAALCAI